MPEFVGKERQDLVDFLAARVDALGRGEDVPRVVVLEGPSGIGKSRIVRELYLSLCRDLEGGPRLDSDEPASDDAGPYWPELDQIERTEAASVDPLPARKSVGPAREGFFWAANAIPAFAWWDVQCERIDRAQNDGAAAAFQKWWEVHGSALIWGWSNRAGAIEELSKRGADALGAFRDEFKDNAMQAIGDTLQKIGIPTGGIALALRHGGRIKDMIAARRSNRSDLRSEITYETDHGTLAEVIAQTLIGIARPEREDKPGNRLPVIIAIEDIHLLGPDLTPLVEAIGRPDATHPVLLIGTSWPVGEAHTREEWSAVRDRMIATGQLEVRDVPDLSISDHKQIVRAYAPRTDDTLVTQVAAHWSTPLALELILTYAPLAENIAASGGRLTLSPEQLAGLPTDLDEIYLARFKALAAGVQRTLCLARASLPDEGLGTDPFTREVLADAVDRMLLQIGTDPVALLATTQMTNDNTKGLLRTAEQTRWLRDLATTGDLAAFTDSQTAKTAASQYKVLMAPDAVIPALRQAVVDELCERIHGLRGDGYLIPQDDPVAQVAVPWLLALPPSAEPQPVAAAVALAFMGQRELAEFHPGKAARLLGEAIAIGALTGQHPDTLKLRAGLAFATRDAGRPDEAAAMDEALLLDQKRILGPDHPDTLWTRSNLANALMKTGRLDEAAAMDEALLLDQERILGPDHPGTLWTRSNLANALMEAGRLDEATAMHEALLLDRQRILGPDHPDTLGTRNNLANALIEAGRLDEAAAMDEALLLDQKRILSPDHPNTLRTRNNLANALSKAGRLDEAITMYEALLLDQERILGPDHPDALTTRNNLASATRDAGRLDEATAMDEALLLDRQRILGPDHPDTLRTRNNLANALKETGRLDEAAAMHEALLLDQERILGPDHPDTLRTRNNLANARKETGRLDEAITMYEALLLDQERILSPDHPDALTTRNNLAMCLRRAGEA